MKFTARIGAIEFGEGEVRVAVIKAGGSTPRVLEVRAVRVVYGSEDERREAMRASLAEAIAQIKSHPTLYVLCAPSASSITRPLTIPFKGRGRVASAVQYELEPFLAFPIDELIVDYVTVREILGTTQVLCVALRRDIVDEQLGILEEAGVSVEGIGIDAVGLTALWHARRGNAAGLHAVLIVREHASVLSVVQDKRLVYLRHIATPVNRFREAPRATAREVQNLLRGFSAGWGADGQVESLSVTGLEPDGETRALFEADFSISVRYESLQDGVTGLTDALENAGLSGAAADAGPDGAQASGVEERWLGLIGVANAAAGGSYALDFLHGDAARAKGQGRRGLVGHLAFTGFLALLALSGYVAYAWLDYRDNQAETERLGKLVFEEFREAYPNVELAQARASDDVGGLLSLEHMQEEAEKESQVSAALSMDLFARPTLLEILSIIAKTMPDNKVGIDNLDVSLTRNLEVAISGQVKDSAAFEEIVQALESSPTITIDPNYRRESQGGAERFVITATN